MGANAWRRVKGSKKDIKEIEKECYGDLCSTGPHLWSQNGGIGRETTTDVAGLQVQLSQEYCGSKEGG